MNNEHWTLNTEHLTLNNKTWTLNLKKTMTVTLDDFLIDKGTLKPLFNQQWGRYCRFSIWKPINNHNCLFKFLMKQRLRFCSESGIKPKTF